MRTLRSLVTLTVAAAIAAGCVSRNVENISAEDAEAMATPPAPTSTGGGDANPGATAPGPTAPSTTAAVAEPGFNVVASVGPDVANLPEGILYVIVRVAGRATGPPLAVKRLPADLPVEFRVTAADSMIAGMPLVDAMDVTIRLDQDGDASSKQDGDLEGAAGPVAVGDTVEVVLAPLDTTAQ